MSDFANWLLGLIKNFLDAFWQFVLDIFIAVAELLLTGLLLVINSIPVPEFLKNGLQAMVNAVPGEVWYFAGHLRLGECFAMLGAAVVFRLVRKAVTLFQW